MSHESWQRQGQEPSQRRSPGLFTFPEGRTAARRSTAASSHGPADFVDLIAENQQVALRGTWRPRNELQKQVPRKALEHYLWLHLYRASSQPGQQADHNRWKQPALYSARKRAQCGEALERIKT